MTLFNNITGKKLRALLPIMVIITIMLYDFPRWQNKEETQRRRELRKEKKMLRKRGFDKPDGYYNFYQEITTPIGKKNSGYRTNYAFLEFKKASQNLRSLKAADAHYEWVQRGPGNVGGRTRTIIIDPDDPTNRTWYAAAVSGGIWRTTNGGDNWTCLTDHLPNLATNTMVMAPSDHNIIYAGTGEGYGGTGMVSGNGIMVSKNKGNSWEIIESTIKGYNFKYVNKLFVDPTDANYVLAATNKGIFKSVDGGLNWDTVYFKGYIVQDLVANPKNSSVIYGGVKGLGIIKSYDKGNKWVDAYDGIGEGGRFSLAVSNVDTSYVFTSVESAASLTEIYFSSNSAKTWNKLNDYDNTFIDFFNGQGWFNNVVEAHPFESRKVFIGGVYLGLVEFKNTVSESDEQVLRVDTVGTGSFLNFISFGASHFSGCMATGLEEDAEVEEVDFVPVEIRFGPGLTQKAHRFTVPVGEGPGVPVDDFSYNDYVTVPFQVWDTRNNVQLMVSFRDQERDGSFNLIERDEDDEISGREYIYVHSLPYKTTADVNIAKSGGHYYKMLYFFWPTLPEDKVWNESLLPVSKLNVKYGRYTMQNATTKVLADLTRNKDLHVDHHDLKMIITDAENKEFTILNANDGGLGISIDGGDTWRQIKGGYITTQFYGVAKRGSANEFIGGMQDNGTWASPEGQDASASSSYNFHIEGDGFEALWHPDYPERMVGSSYENYIKVSIDGGKTWKTATSGMHGDGPFVTRLTNSPKNPNVVYAIGNKGLYRHNNFCMGLFGWKLIELGKGWAINDLVTIGSHNVEISLADPKVIWAGAGMYAKPDLHIFLSRNNGEKFDTIPNYYEREMGYLTSIATHPTDTGTAYLLYSLPFSPKILRTTNYGETWDDITGFGKDSTSNNGFPDVMVYSLLVMPYNTDIIWVGTEIGIFESTDNGESWHYANNGLPAVSVWQMFIQDNTIVVATHGRGIWSAGLYPVNIEKPSAITDDQFSVYPNPASGPVQLDLTAKGQGTVNVRIFDISGKQVYSAPIQKKDTNLQQKIDLGHLAKGIYIISAEFDSKVYNSKLIIR